MPHLIISGGNGYLGEALVGAALGRGWQVTSLERRPKARGAARLRRLPWCLGDPLPAAVLDGRDAADTMIVHAAHEWDTAGGADDPNRAGTNALLHSSRALGIGRFVFVSSVSAREDALNVYGRLKWQLEERVSAEGGVSARVGLVYGGARRAQYGVLLRLAGMGLLPMIDPHRQVQPIHLSEVCAGLLSLAAARRLAHGVYVLAAPAAITFAEFLRTLARVVHRRRLLILPVPAAFALLAADLNHRIPFLPTVNRERILGLKGMQFVPSGEGLSEIGLVVGAMPLKLAGEPALRRRGLLGEARVLLSYVLGAPPPKRLLRHYVRALDASGAEDALALPPGVRRWPWLLRLAEPLRGPSALSQRLLLATRLAETSAVGTDRFFAYRGGRWGRLVRAGSALALDVLLLPLRRLRR
jgi:nucleoside-diphosphate-sugar epimerase